MTKSKTPSKKTGTKAPAKKKSAKKVVAKKKAAPKKAASTRKPAAGVTKKITPKKTIRRKAALAAITKQKTKKKENKVVVETIEASLPPVEEKSPEINSNTSADVPGLDEKSMQRAAVRNYDNHHIRLSNRKGGIKPSGKKPLW
jgi:hypothetical protein